MLAMAREPGMLPRAPWRSTRESVDAFVGHLRARGDAELASFYLRHPASLDARVFAFVQRGPVFLPSVSSVLAEAHELAERQRGASLLVERPVVEPREVEGEFSSADVDEWWRERMLSLRRLDVDAWKASVKSARERGVVVEGASGEPFDG